MKPGHGEVLIAEGDVEVRRGGGAARAGVPPPARHGHVGRRPRAQHRPGAARRGWSAPSRTSRATPTASSSSRAPPAAEPPGRADTMLLALHRHRDRHRRAAVGGRAAVAQGGARAPPGPPRPHPRLGLRPRPRAPRRAARPPAAALVRQRRGVGDVPRPRVHPRLGRAGRGCRDAAASATTARRRAVRLPLYPHKPIVAYLPQTRELLNEYCVEFPDETRPYGSARLPDSDDVLAKWMALTGDEQRLIATRQHAPARPPGRPQAGAPRPLAPEPVGARAPAPHAALARRRRHAARADPRRRLALRRAGRRRR